jgi:benzylsuccinate CoA-transferase BbsF subunit
VLDFTWFGAGPVGSKWLAAAGAQVIRIESQNRVDGMRPQEPKVGDAASPNSSLFFNNVNSDKLSVLLDLNNPKGMALAKRLVAVSDVVMTNFSPRTLDRWRLHYEDLRQIKDDIIVLHIPAMGLTGPKREYGGFGAGFKAMGGLNMLMGFEDTPAVGPQGAYTDWVLVPSHCQTALLAALHYRKRTGKGQLIEISQYECVINATGTAILEYTSNGRRPARTGNRHPTMSPHGPYPCEGDDRWVAIAVENNEQWQALCRVAGRSEWAEDARFDSPAARLKNAEALDECLASWTRTRDPHEVMRRLQSAGVPAGVVQDVQDIFERDPQLAARKHFVWVDHPETGSQPTDSTSFRFSRMDATPQRGAPCMGEHNDLVLQGILGLSTDEINQLIIDNVLY